MNQDPPSSAPDHAAECLALMERIKQQLRDVQEIVSESELKKQRGDQPLH